MQLIRTFLLASLAAGIHGFVVPVGTPDGEYFVAFDENNQPIGGLVPVARRDVDGNPINAPIPVTRRNAETEGVSPRHGGATLDKRDSLPGSPSVGCLGRQLDGGTEHDAWQQGVNFCNNGGLIYHGIQTWVAGNSVWYACNYNGDAQRCSGTNLKDAGDRIYNQCGPVQAAWCFVSQWNLSFGREILGEGICTNF